MSIFDVFSSSFRMKYFAFSIAFFCSIAVTAQIDNYFKIFAPNTTSEAAAIKTSPQKTVVEYTAERKDFAAQDSMQYIHALRRYNPAGLLIEDWDYENSKHRVYEYDKKGKLVRYTEISPYERDKGSTIIDIEIAYDKKGKITAIKNKANDMEARRISFFADEEKLLIATMDGFTDELYFTNGRITKLVCKISEITDFTAEYTYDAEGHVIQQTGIQNGAQDGGKLNYKITNTYNANAKITKGMLETWGNTPPVVEEEYFYHYSANNLLESYLIKGIEDEFSYTYSYDSLDRRIKTNYFENRQFWQSLFTVYY